VLLASSLVLLGAPSAHAYLYWANYIGDTIARANIDGTGVNESFVTNVPDGGGMAADAAHLYWAYRYHGQIGRVGIDGTGASAGFIFSGTDAGGVAVDDAHVYWADQDTDTIGRANLDGSQPKQDFITGAVNPIALAVDGAHIYWGNREGGDSSRIGRANLDGSGVDQSFIIGTNNPVGVAVDGAHVYWTQLNASKVGRANIDGSDVNNDLITGLASPEGIAVDAAHIYFAQNGRISRANLDGTGLNASFIVSANGPSGIALDPPGIATPSPASLSFNEQLVGGPGASQTLSIKNTGRGTLHVGKASISGPERDDFAITSDGCSDHTLARAAVCELGVHFGPRAAGARNAALSIASDDPGAPLVVQLAGAGAVPPPAAPPVVTLPVAPPSTATKTTTVSVRGGALTLRTPKGCVAPGAAFRATVTFRRKAAGAKLRRVDFTLGSAKPKTDTKAPFTQTLRVAATAKPGATLRVRARATVRSARGATTRKTITSSVKVCG